ARRLRRRRRGSRRRLAPAAAAARPRALCRYEPDPGEGGHGALRLLRRTLPAAAVRAFGRTAAHARGRDRAMGDVGGNYPCQIAAAWRSERASTSWDAASIASVATKPQIELRRLFGIRARRTS